MCRLDLPCVRNGNLEEPGLWDQLEGGQSWAITHCGLNSVRGTPGSNGQKSPVAASDGRRGRVG